MCSLCNTHYCWGLADLLKMYALEFNISVAPCSWVLVIEIQSLEILFRSCKKNIIYTAYVHTWYYINSWASVVRCRSSSMLWSFNCATFTDVAKDWHAFFMWRVKEDNKSQFLILFLFIKFYSFFLFVLFHFFVPCIFLSIIPFSWRWLIPHLSWVFFIFVYFLFNLNVYM